MVKIKATTGSVLKFLWPYIWRNQPLWLKAKILLFIFATLLTTALLLSVPLALKYAIATLETHQGMLGLPPIVIIVIYGLLWMLTKIINRLRHQATFPMIANVIHKLTLDLFAHLQWLSTRFHHQRKSGQILNAVSKTRYGIAFFMQAIFQEIAPVTLQVVLASVLLTYYYGPSYGSVLLLMLILYFLLSIKTADHIVKCRQVQNEMDGKANAYIVDSILNAETVKYFDMSDYEMFQTLNLLKKKESADVASLMADAKIHLMQNGIIGIAVIFLTLMSGYAVFNNTMKVSDFVMVNGFVLMFMQPLSMLGYFYRQVKLSLAQLEPAMELFQIPIEIQDKSTAHPLVLNKGEIKFDHVRFGFSSKRIILDDLSFTVPAGSTTAIVGETGSGKSTISKLLFRLYNVDSGSITIDGQDVREVTNRSLCQALGIVPQDPVLFNDTLYNNICYANIRLSDAQLQQILKSAQLEAFVNDLPDNLNTVVGERGLKLSGGERQRVAIARMLARHPQIMVFDEATSALDLKTEKQIQDCLDEISKNITTIIIAHRLSTVRYADNIIVLDNGSIVEQGTHESLLQKKGFYFRLLAKQNRTMLTG